MSVTNSVRLIGRLVKNPELKHGGATGRAYVRFRLACDRPVAVEKALAGAQDTDYLDCVAFGQNAEFMAQYLVQGDTVGLEGTLESQSQEVAVIDSRTKKAVTYSDGSAVLTYKTFTTAVASSVQFVGARRQADARTQSAGRSNPRLAPIAPKAPVPASAEPEPALSTAEDPFADDTPDVTGQPTEREMAGVSER